MEGQLSIHGRCPAMRQARHPCPEHAWQPQLTRPRPRGQETTFGRTHQTRIAMFSLRCLRPAVSPQQEPQTIKAVFARPRKLRYLLPRAASMKQSLTTASLQSRVVYMRRREVLLRASPADPERNLFQAVVVRLNRQITERNLCQASSQLPKKNESKIRDA